jgi:hypothetical protein
MEYIRKTLEWRYKYLWPYHRVPKVSPALHCLPIGVYDPLGRPILCVRVSRFAEAPESLQADITSSIEALRIHLKTLKSDMQASRELLPLQYTVLLDLKDLSMQAIVRGLSFVMLTCLLCWLNIEL